MPIYIYIYIRHKDTNFILQDSNAPQISPPHYQIKKIYLLSWDLVLTYEKQKWTLNLELTGV